MKTKLLYLALFGFTFAAILLYPTDWSSLLPAAKALPPPNNPSVVAAPVPVVKPEVPPQPVPAERPRIDVVFALDTTGSMAGLIQAAKEKIWSIASSMAQGQPAPEIRIGLVAYRDRGDDYVTQMVNLSADLDSVYAKLMDFKADGGGDTPESVNQALSDAVNKMAWSADPKAYKVVFLVGDAPPHTDYPDDVKYGTTLELAKQRGIIVNAIQCGQLPGTQSDWKQIAMLGQGQYFQVGQSGSAVAVATPYDKKLADLSAKLDATRMYYGSGEEKAKTKVKQEATAKLQAEASVESRARRAAFNATKSGEANLIGDKELVDDVSKGRVDLSKIDHDKLPEPIQALPPAEQQAVIEGKAKERAELQKQIDELAQQRAAHIKQQLAKQGSVKDSLDEKLYGAVRSQAEKKGMSYAAPAAAY
jgi:Mg-chelatase subunit ChlD